MENQKKQQANRTILIGVSVLGLCLVYFFQRIDYANTITSVLGLEAVTNQNVIFSVNKTLRLVVNDLLCLLLIRALFEQKKYVRIAFFVFCFELLFVLPAYLIVKLNTEGSSEISSPLLSQIHRLIVNPMLMMLLIVGFYFQRWGRLRV